MKMEVRLGKYSGRHVGVLMLFLPLFLPMPALTQDSGSTPSLQARLNDRLDALRSDLISFRRDLHRHPELSGQEKRTARVLAERLDRLGLDTRTGVGGHGVVALLKGGKPGPVVAFRADMDAVTSQHADPVDFPSVVPGVRHICGHDIHVTVGVALAEAFASFRNDLAGSLLLIFQPAEETARGAGAMIQAGALKEIKPDAIFAYHTSPIEVGSIGTKSGVMLAGRDRLRVVLTGADDLSGPAAEARKAIEAMNSVAPGTNSVQGDFITARVDRSRSQGTGWVLDATTTSTSAEMRAKAKKNLGHALDALASQGVKYNLQYQERVIQGVSNDPVLERASHAPIRSVVGDDGLVILQGVPTLFSEDFGAFQDKVPGVMYFLGVSNSAKGTVGMPHSPQYVADEEAIFVGARVMFAVMLDYVSSYK